MVRLNPSVIASGGSVADAPTVRLRRHRRRKRIWYLVALCESRGLGRAACRGDALTRAIREQRGITMRESVYCQRVDECEAAAAARDDVLVEISRQESVFGTVEDGSQGRRDTRGETASTGSGRVDGEAALGTSAVVDSSDGGPAPIAAGKPRRSR